jgi:hypothetical protein
MRPVGIFTSSVTSPGVSKTSIGLLLDRAGQTADADPGGPGARPALALSRVEVVVEMGDVLERKRCEKHGPSLL